MIMIMAIIEWESGAFSYPRTEDRLSPRASLPFHSSSQDSSQVWQQGKQKWECRQAAAQANGPLAKSLKLKQFRHSGTQQAGTHGELKRAIARVTGHRKSQRKWKVKSEKSQNVEGAHLMGENDGPELEI